MKSKFIERLFSPPKKPKHANQSTNPALVTEGEHDLLDAGNLGSIKEHIKQIFGNTLDMHLEDITFGTRPALLCYLESMADSSVINDRMVKPLTRMAQCELDIRNKTDFERARKQYFGGISYQYAAFQHDIVWLMLEGFAVVIVQGLDEAVGFLIDGIEKRSISEPSTQTVIRGPKDGFTEIIRTNISLIRRRIKNPNLRFETFHIGKDTRTMVAMGYVEGIVNQDIVKEVRVRIKKIETSAIFESGNIEEFIADKTLTPFPLSYNSERADTISGHLLDGKVCILVDGTPFVLSVPAVLTDFFVVAEDYYQPYLMATFLRFIRYFAFLLALILPSLWVSTVTFHYELIPSTLLISIISQREGVPFPAYVELMIMEITFEILREAGVRMPRAVGQTVSIVGALVIGQAAVEAGIVSNLMVIIVAVTAISSFVSPIYSFATSTRLLRFIFATLSAFLGLYGMLLGLIAMVAHLASLRSFGVPYLSSVAPFIIEDQKDVFLRFPFWMMNSRPKTLNAESPIKVKNSKSPTPPKGGTDPT